MSIKHQELDVNLLYLVCYYSFIWYCQFSPLTLLLIGSCTDLKVGFNHIVLTVHQVYTNANLHFLLVVKTEGINSLKTPYSATVNVDRLSTKRGSVLGIQNNSSCFPCTANSVRILWCVSGKQTAKSLKPSAVIM